MLFIFVCDTYDCVDHSDILFHITEAIIHIQKSKTQYWSGWIICIYKSIWTNNMWSAKIRIIIKFLLKTFNEQRTMGAIDLDILWAWFDATYYMHPNICGHKGRFVCFWILYNTFQIMKRKDQHQKLNKSWSRRYEWIPIFPYMDHKLPWMSRLYN